MRNQLASFLRKEFSKSPFVFLTGDLGFSAFEELQTEMQDRFINAGIAEQNMVSVAAGLAICNEPVWVYSIAPFCYARPFEQIRNDICYHQLPVKIVGNGGGYAYGAMGYTHHAIEDYGVLLTLKGIEIFIPAFDQDLPSTFRKMMLSKQPNYLRLGRCELTQPTPLFPYRPWRKILEGDGRILLAVGPLAGGYYNYFSKCPRETRPEIWVLTELPITFSHFPSGFVLASKEKGVIVAEEHVQHGSVGESLVYEYVSNGIQLPHFKHFCAKGYPSGKIGSQKFHRRESDLMPLQIAKECHLNCLR